MIFNPKNDSHRWNCHYASFSEKFVDGILDEKGDAGIILDPWNGYGTTTISASLHGIQSYGIDINPVAIVIANARQCTSDEESIFEYLQRIVQIDEQTELLKDDMLTDFFDVESSVKIRSIVKRIYDVFNMTDKAYEEFDDKKTECAVLMCSLFETIKRIYRGHVKNSNPTWTKNSIISFEKEFSLQDALIDETKRIISNIETNRKTESFVKATIHLADSRKAKYKVPLFDTIITSPPYCTRIDYAISTKLELAILGIGREKFKKLRNEFIGTSTINHDIISENEVFGPYIKGLLSQISNHNSYASKCYYSKTYLQYFTSINTSLKALDSALKRHGEAFIVVQDSYYKDVHVDLPRAYTEVCNGIGWELQGKTAFEKKTCFSTIHSKGKIKNRRIETVLHFRKMV